MGSSLQTMIRDLGSRRGRERRGLVLAEGVRLVEEALAASIPIRGVAISPALEGTPRGRALKAALAERRVGVEELPDAELEALADTEQPQGVIAVLEPPVWGLEEIRLGPGAVVLVLDRVQDPGNVGTMLRTALGLGAAGVIALKGTAELGNPKVLRGSMGASFRLPAVPSTAESFLQWAADRDVEAWVTAADAPSVVETLAESGGRRSPIALILGNEGAGVGAVLEAAARRRVAIPLAPGVESLNVAVAAGILLYEVTRAD
jgi:TrmH family RNA methyltransferase